jgi:hypothetical protein
MKSERENFLKLTADMGSLDGRLVGLRSELNTLKVETQPLEHESLKSEIRGDPDYLSKKKAVEKNQGRIRDIDREVTEGEKRQKAMLEILVELRQKATTELTLEWRGIFERGLKSFIQKARVALQAELDLEELRKKAIAAFNEIGSSCSIGDWPSVLMRNRTYSASPSELEKFIERMKLAGYDVK